MDLTKRQQEIFDFIKRYSAKYGYPPTVRDIGKAVGLASSSTVHAHLANLEKVGLLRRDPSKPRAIELLDRAVEGVKSVVRPSGLPLVGQVAAGSPVLAEENIEEYIDVPELAGGEVGEYLLRVRGDSMKNAGIIEDDVVVVRPDETARDGQIVVALVGEEATVKRFFRESDHIRLRRRRLAGRAGRGRAGGPRPARARPLPGVRRRAGRDGAVPELRLLAHLTSRRSGTAWPPGARLTFRARWSGPLSSSPRSPLPWLCRAARRRRSTRARPSGPSRPGSKVARATG
jgi:repressor LexA